MRVSNAVVYAGIILMLGSASSAVLAAEHTQQQTLRNEIVIYNLINGLYLSRGQAEAIREKANDLLLLQDALKREAERNSHERTDAMVRLREEVKKESPDVSRTLARRIHASNRTMEVLKKRYSDSQAEAVQAVKNILTDSQLYQIEHFKPCLVPSKQGPRIGQSEGATHLVRMLERIRTIPSVHYEARKYEIARRFRERLSRKKPTIASDNLATIEAEFLSVLDKARSLSDIDFAISKNNLAQKVKDTIFPPKKGDLNKRIARFLLSPAACTVLEDTFPPEIARK